jgi:lipopolysaccharide/colanic/teichoic acid biosynthesis glycosyltransferase
MESVLNTNLQRNHMFTVAEIPVITPEKTSTLYWSDDIMNDVIRMNKYLIERNEEMEVGDQLNIRFESMEARQKRLFQKYPVILRYPLYIFDFILHRVFPKLDTTKALYFELTKGKGRIISLAEMLGRIYSCGFKVVEYRLQSNITVVTAEKISESLHTKNPSYGPLIKLERVGYKGKLISVYKFRTMHPFSEFIQEYVFHKNNLADGGKINNDFRVTFWGKFLRALWIDELPMVLNFIKGEMKLVGVRPLSLQYFKLYPKEVQDLRTSIKPGLIPPFYADMPVTFEDIVESERKYLISYKKNPIRTDMVYFFKAMRNILFKNVRSS